jgi:hypothetical protein
MVELAGDAVTDTEGECIGEKGILRRKASCLFLRTTEFSCRLLHAADVTPISIIKVQKI